MKYASVEQNIEIGFSSLLLLLHEEGLNELIHFANEFQLRMENLTKKSNNDSSNKQQTDRIATTHGEDSAATVLINAARERLPTIAEDGTIGTSSKGLCHFFYIKMHYILLHMQKQISRKISDNLYQLSILFFLKIF